MISLCDMATTKAVPQGHNCRSLRTQFGEKWKNVLEMFCAIKSNPASILTAPLSEQGRGRGYKREIKLIKGLKGVIYEKSLREMNM